MFNFLKARMSTMLRSARSLTLRGKLTRALREHEALFAEKDGAFAKEFEAAFQIGDVLKVKEVLLKQWSQSEKLIDTVLFKERDVFMAEYRQLDDLGAVAQDFERFRKRCEQMKRDESLFIFSHVAIVYEELAKKLEPKIADVARQARARLQEEYLAVERQRQGKMGELQNRVFSVNEVMAMMDKLWDVRSELRAQQHGAKSLSNALQGVFTLFHATPGHFQGPIDPRVAEQLKSRHGFDAQMLGMLVKHGFDPAHTLTLLDRLRKKGANWERELAAETDALTREYAKMIGDFHAIILVLSHVYFLMAEHHDKHFRGSIARLEQAHFPQTSLELIKKVLEEKLKQRVELLDSLAAIFQRGGRLGSRLLAA